MSALSEAQAHKRGLERNLLEALKDFTDTSGLVVEDIHVIKRNVSALGDPYPKFIYGIELEIKV